jgi:hypothetical protein
MLPVRPSRAVGRAAGASQAWAILIGFIILSATVAFVGRYETSAMPGGRRSRDRSVVRNRQALRADRG